MSEFLILGDDLEEVDLDVYAKNVRKAKDDAESDSTLFQVAKELGGQVVSIDVLPSEKEN